MFSNPMATFENNELQEDHRERGCAELAKRTRGLISTALATKTENSETVTEPVVAAFVTKIFIIEPK